MKLGYRVKREVEDLGSTAQPVIKKVKKESADPDWHVNDKQQHNLQQPNDLNTKFHQNVKTEEDTKFHQNVKTEEDTKFHQNVKLERIHNSLARNLLKEELYGNELLTTGDVKWRVETLCRVLPNQCQIAELITTRWKDLTEEECFRKEIWWRYQWMKPTLACLDMFWRNLSNDLKVGIAKQTEVRKTFYEYTRRVVDMQLNREPNEDVLYAFAIYFRETQEDVKKCFAAMTRQEVYDTCLLRYFATSRREKEKYEKELVKVNTRIMQRLVLFWKDGGHSLKVNHLSKEEIEAYLKRMPRTIEVEPLKEGGGILKRKGRQIINVLDIKPCPINILPVQINCRWKDLTAEKNFKYEVARTFGGVIRVEDINAAWRNLGNNMRVKNLEQTRSKVYFFAETERKMERELNEGVLYSFSSYFCEFENVIKTEFPGMTETEVYDTCLLRYIAAPTSTRDVYEMLSAREECKKLYESRFRNVP